MRFKADVFHMNYPGNFYQHIERHALAAPDATCVYTGSDEVLSRDWLHAMAGRYANALLALGCVRGDRVAVQVEKSVQALCVYLACVRAGLVFLPLNTAYQPDELAFLLSDAAPALFVCRPSHKHQLFVFGRGRMTGRVDQQHAARVRQGLRAQQLSRQCQRVTRGAALGRHQRQHAGV